MVTMVTGYKLSSLNLPGPLKTLYNCWTSELVGVAVTTGIMFSGSGCTVFLLISKCTNTECTYHNLGNFQG